MEISETALGRLVPIHEGQTFLEDSVLKVLFEYRMSPHNPNNVPMKLSDIVRSVASEDQLVAAALDALKEQAPPLVEERESFQQNRTFRITGSGVGFVRNMPQGVASVA
jgi:3-hydroxyacyl-CoA dehydrogenase